MVYILCASFALAAMFAYITGSSFVFTQFFSLSEQKFALLFGANALGFVICANINARLVLKYESEKILAKALMIMFISTVILLVNAFFHPNFLLFELSIFTSIAMLGFIAPNTTTLAMARFKNIAELLLRCLERCNLVLQGLFLLWLGPNNANTPIILAFVMCACVLVANMIYFLIKIKDKK